MFGIKYRSFCVAVIAVVAARDSFELDSTFKSDMDDDV